MNWFERFDANFPRLAPWTVIFVLVLALGLAGIGDGPMVA